MPGKALIVLAHPAERSLSRLFAQTAHEALSSAGHETILLDLYAEKFDPVLSSAERAAYYASPPETAAIADKASLLAEAEVLVLVFPTWWFGMPAILKGWIDRVFAPGVAFDHAIDFGPIKPKLTKLKKVVVITTLGSPAWIDWLVMRRPRPPHPEYRSLRPLRSTGKVRDVVALRSGKSELEKHRKFQSAN